MRRLVGLAPDSIAQDAMALIQRRAVA
jgi:hypothetical protein